MRASDRGIALFVVVSILTVVAIIAVSFVFSMVLETQESRQFASVTQARYIAEAGVNHAQALLDEDKLATRIDTLTEPWAQQFAGTDVDVADEDAKTARWVTLSDRDGQPRGRYAVQVSDEAGKINLNTALAHPSQGVDAPNLTTLLTAAGVSGAAQVADAIEQYRYGPDGRPGVAQVDDDRDGSVDEPNEYQPLALAGDDDRLDSLEEIARFAQLSQKDLDRLSRVATVYSWDVNLSLTGTPRLNVNTATAEELLAVLMDAGVENPWQMAVNIVDAADSDQAMSRVTKRALMLTISNEGPNGDWAWSDAARAYTTARAGGLSLEWHVSTPAARYRVLVHGVPGSPVGTLTLGGQTFTGVNSGDMLGPMDLGGTFSIRAACAGASACAFRGVELIPPEDSTIGALVNVRGTEAVRINEIMVNPSIELSAGAAVFEPQLSNWSCNGNVCDNSGTGTGRWTWTVKDAPPGRYRAWVYGASAGQMVGLVDIGGDTKPLWHGQRHPSTVAVGGDGKISLTIGKTAAEGTYSFQTLVLSLKPDAEYIELINLSTLEMDVGGWSFEGEATGGRQARLPSGSRIAPHGLLVAAVDPDDGQPGLSGDGIAARAAWEMPAGANVVQLEFLEGALNPDTEWLIASGGGPARLMLRNGESIVDEVEYWLPRPRSLTSLEKGDPSEIRDDNGNGVDDGWYSPKRLYSPGEPNDNAGLEEIVGQQIIAHDPTETTVAGRPLTSLGDLAGIPTGTAWRAISSTDLARIVDRLTVAGLRLESAGHGQSGGAAGGGWHEHSDGFECHTQGAVQRWQWTPVADGQYRLSLYGWSGEQLAVRWALAGNDWSDWTPAIIADPQGRFVVGEVSVGAGASAAQTLTLEARCETPGGICHMNAVSLDPQLVLIGLVNVNTASRDVLMSLPDVTSGIAERIIAGRPYGDQDEKHRGTGDLLMGSVLGSTEAEKIDHFRKIAHLITVRSSVFQITSLGEALERDKTVASKRIRAVVER